MRLACGRIAGGARAIAEAHRLGVPEGQLERPWAAAYHRESVRVYFESLPWSYQSDVAALFSQSADTMDERCIPGRLAADWAIVTEYLRNASAAIEDYMQAHDPDQHPDDPAELSTLSGPPPMIIHYDTLARLTTRDGANRLEQAALMVMEHMSKSEPVELDPAERHLLRRVASGTPIVELAAELGYSRRSMFRQLDSLWKKLKVTNRAEGLRKAQSEGWLD